MDRYFIARNQSREASQRLVLPTRDDLSRYGAPAADPYEKERPLQEKAYLCGRIVKQRNRGVSERDLTIKAAELMKLPMEALKKMYKK